MRLGASTRKYNTGNKTLVGQSARRQVFMRWKEVRAFLIPSATKRNLWQSWDPRKQTVLNFINYLKFYWEFKGYNYYGIDIYCQHLLIILLAFELREQNLTAIVNPHSITAFSVPLKLFVAKVRNWNAHINGSIWGATQRRALLKCLGILSLWGATQIHLPALFRFTKADAEEKFHVNYLCLKVRAIEKGVLCVRSAPSHLPLSVSVRFFFIVPHGELI